MSNTYSEFEGLLIEREAILHSLVKSVADKADVEQRLAALCDDVFAKPWPDITDSDLQYFWDFLAPGATPFSGAVELDETEFPPTPVGLEQDLPDYICEVCGAWEGNGGLPCSECSSHRLSPANTAPVKAANEFVRIR